MPAISPVRARALARPRTSAGPGRMLAGALAGALSLALAATPVHAQTAPAEPAADTPAEPAADTPPEPAADTPPEPAADTPPKAAPDTSADRPATAEATAEAPADQSAPAAATEAATQQPAIADMSARRSLAWIAIGAAAAFVTTSAVLGLAVESREDDMQFLIDFRAPGIGVPSRYDGDARARYEELADEAETLSTYSWITLGLAGVAVASATALFLLDDTGEPAEAPASARSHLAPTLLPGGMGVTLDWEF